MKITVSQFEENFDEYFDYVLDGNILHIDDVVLVPIELYERLSQGGTSAFNPEVEGSTPS